MSARHDRLNGPELWKPGTEVQNLQMSMGRDGQHPATHEHSMLWPIQRRVAQGDRNDPRPSNRLGVEDAKAPP